MGPDGGGLQWRRAEFQRGIGTADDGGRAGPVVRARLGMFHGPPGPVQGGASAGGVAGAADFGSRAGLRGSERSRPAAAGPGTVHGHGADGVCAFGLRAAGRQKHAEPDGAVGERADPAKARQITVDFDALDELLVELYLVCGERRQMPKRLVLDIDATDVELHGRQEHRLYHGYYHAYCYLPRLVFCNGWPVRTELRTSSGDVAAGVVETIAPLVDRLRKRFPQVPILIRADGAYCRDELMTWCEARGVDYVLGLPRNDRLKDRVQPLMDDLRDRLKQDPDYAQQAVRGYQSFGYRTRDSWSRERRVIAKAEWLPGPPVGNADGEPAGKADGGPEAGAEDPCATVGEARYNSRFVVTSLQKPNAQTVYEAMYCDQGAAENWIKEQKNDLFLDRCSSGLWNVNALRLRLSALAHALYCMMKHRLEHLLVSAMLHRSHPSTLREHLLVSAMLHRSHPSTLREHLFRIPVRVTVSTRRIHLAFGYAFPYWKDFRLIWASLAPT